MSVTLHVSWPAVTQNAQSGGLAHPIDRYEVKYFVGNGPMSNDQSGTVTATTNQVDIPGVQYGQVGVSVRAIDTENNAGEWTAWDMQQIDSPVIPPAAPGSVTVTYTHE